MTHHSEETVRYLIKYNLPVRSCNLDNMHISGRFARLSNKDLQTTKPCDFTSYFAARGYLGCLIYARE